VQDQGLPVSGDGTTEEADSPVLEKAVASLTARADKGPNPYEAPGCQETNAP
jgi:hypothetical protein